MANLDRFRELLLGFTEHDNESESLLRVLGGYTNKDTFSEDHLKRVTCTAVASSGSDSGGASAGIAAAQLYKWVKGVERSDKMGFTMY